MPDPRPDYYTIPCGAIAQSWALITMSSVAPPIHQREANPTDRPTFDPKMHLRRQLQRHVMKTPHSHQGPGSRTLTGGGRPSHGWRGRRKPSHPPSLTEAASHGSEALPVLQSVQRSVPERRRVRSSRE